MTSRNDQGSRTIDLARQEANAALSILLDPATGPSSAEVHILGSWRLLFEGVDESARSEDATELCAWIQSNAKPLTASQRERAATLVSELAKRECVAPRERRTGPGHRELLKHVRGLQRVIEAFEPDLRTPAAMRRIWLGRVAAVVAALVVLTAFLLVIRDKTDLGNGPWRGDYYPTHTFEGTPILRRDSDIDFSWGHQPPLERISADLFSMRWDTCLVLPEDATFRFWLTSDDGSRLFVDGTPIIDLWEARGRAQKDATMDLEAGVHHLRLDYFERRGSAGVTLRASIDGEKPGPIPGDLLYYPGDELDAADPCRAVRGESDE